MSESKTPEDVQKAVQEVLGDFLQAWLERDAARASKSVQRSYAFSADRNIALWAQSKRNDKPPRRPMSVREEITEKLIGGWPLKAWKITEVRLLSDVMADASVTLTTGSFEVDVDARLICEEGPFRPRPDGSWGVNLTSLSRIKAQRAI